MQEQNQPAVIRSLLRLFKVSSTEDLLKKLVKIVFTIILLIPLFLLPLYFFFFTLLHL